MNDNKVYSKANKSALSIEDIDRIIEMAWEDRTPFEAIEKQFGINESTVIKIMRKELKRSSFNLWRKRVNSGISQKHAQLRDPAINRFKCALQRQITHNKISKR
ncbi:MAG: TIGR03643 family protein [Chitinophagaceae bacterium]